MAALRVSFNLRTINRGGRKTGCTHGEREEIKSLGAGWFIPFFLNLFVIIWTIQRLKKSQPSSHQMEWIHWSLRLHNLSLSSVVHTIEATESTFSLFHIQTSPVQIISPMYDEVIESLTACLVNGLSPFGMSCSRMQVEWVCPSLFLEWTYIN